MPSATGDVASDPSRHFAMANYRIAKGSFDFAVGRAHAGDIRLTAFMEYRAATARPSHLVPQDGRGVECTYETLAQCRAAMLLTWKGWLLA